MVPLAFSEVDFERASNYQETDIENNVTSNSQENLEEIILDLSINENNVENFFNYLSENLEGISESELVELEDLNKKEFHFYTRDKKYIYRINVIPTRFDETKLQSEIQTILGQNSYNYSVFLYDLNSGQSVAINEEKIMPPGSISKVPVGIMALREVDNGTLALNQQIQFTANSAANPSNVLTAINIGQFFSLDTYLRFLIIDSDNSSILRLENLLGGNLNVNERVKNELEVEHFFRNPHDVTAKDLGRVFMGIYYEEYLTKSSNEYFLELLQNTHPVLQDGIPVWIPEPYKSQIAHKTGQISTVPGYAWADAGIIYGPKTDYVLVILNEKVAIPEARYKVQQVSKVVWETLQV